VVTILGLLLTYPIWCRIVQAAAPGITVPGGTKINALKYNDTSGTVVELKPAEQDECRPPVCVNRATTVRKSLTYQPSVPIFLILLSCRPV
jgi:hypothetical protein